MPKKPRFNIELILEDKEWPFTKEERKNLVSDFRMAFNMFRDYTLGSYEPTKFLNGPLHVSLTLSNNVRVAKLNEQWRGKNKPTNILSFPAPTPINGHDLIVIEGEEVELGDLILAYEVVQDEAQAQGKTLFGHTLHLCVHGLLHLLGFDHKEQGEAEAMEALEVILLEHLGIYNPYHVRAF